MPEALASRSPPRRGDPPVETIGRSDRRSCPRRSSPSKNFRTLSTEEGGSLTIRATPNGPTVDVRIDAQGSKGITNMQISCCDLMLADLATRRGMDPGFFIHDSHLFDGVDERQVAKAPQFGADHAASVGYQYVGTMNSDAPPRDGFRSGFDVDALVRPTKLTDAAETGGLFGLRFN